MLTPVTLTGGTQMCHFPIYIAYRSGIQFDQLCVLHALGRVLKEDKDRNLKLTRTLKLTSSIWEKQIVDNNMIKPQLQILVSNQVLIHVL